jgi:hypothetical protein
MNLQNYNMFQFVQKNFYIIALANYVSVLHKKIKISYNGKRKKKTSPSFNA